MQFITHKDAEVSDAIRLQDLVESGDKSLSKPEGEDELGAGHEELGSETLEEGAHALVLGHVCDDSETRLLGLEVAVLDTGLDDIERSRDDERSRGTGDGGDKVLRPRSGVVVGELVEVFLGSCGTTEELQVVSVGVIGYVRCKTLKHTANEPGALRAAVQPQPR